jgi:hypothetical protein
MASCAAAATTLWNVSKAHYLATRLDGTTTFSQVYQEQTKQSYIYLIPNQCLACGQSTTVLSRLYITLLPLYGRGKRGNKLYEHRQHIVIYQN